MNPNPAVTVYHNVSIFVIISFVQEFFKLTLKYIFTIHKELTYFISLFSYLIYINPPTPKLNLVTLMPRGGVDADPPSDLPK
jgi:hypothetical protein